MKLWPLNIELEPGWKITGVVQDDTMPPTVFAIRVSRGSQSWFARYDVDKNTFLEELPITIDASQVRGIVRGLVQ